MRNAVLALIIAASATAACAKKEAPSPNTSSSAPATTASEEKQPFKELSLDDVDARIAKKDGKTFIFDANPKEVFDKHHLPGAVYVPDEGVTASLLPADKTAALIFYCANTH